MSGYEAFSATAASNSNVDGAGGTNIAENNAPATINNALRALVAEFAKLRDLIGGAKVSAGTADVQTLTSGLGLTAYQQGILIGFEAGSGLTNTGACTMNVDSIGAKSVKLVDGSDPPAGAITAGGIYLLAYESGADVLLLLNPTPVAAAASIEQGMHTIWIPASAMIPATTNGPASAQQEASSNAENYITLAFDASTDEYAHFVIAMPKSWDEGTITFQVFWSTTATDTDGVAWGLQGVAVSDGDAIDASWGSAVVVTDVAQSAAGDVLVTAVSGAVTIAGTPAAGDVCFFRLFRDVSDANDDMTEDALLIGVKVLYTVAAADDS